jgi:hypothetical protein
MSTPLVTPMVAETFSTGVVHYDDVILPPDPLSMRAITPEEIKRGYEIFTPMKPETEGQGDGDNDVNAVESYIEVGKHQV